MPGPWVDPSDARVIAIIAGPDADPDDPQVQASVIDVVAESSELLSALTGYLVHPSGVATEEYTASPFATRLTPTWRPAKEILDVFVIVGCQTFDVQVGWCLHAGEVVLTGRWARLAAADSGWRALLSACGCQDPPERLRLTYRYGSTVTAAARAALLAYARQLFLRDNPDAGECALPERVTSVNREGLSYTMFDPQTYLDKGRTGVPTVDVFLSAFNPGQAKRPAAVYTPDAPPGVTVARPVGALW